MAVMQVGVMRMPVNHRGVAVKVGMRLAGRHAWAVLMLVMFIMSVAVLML
jgi:hypothetical protein